VLHSASRPVRRRNAARPYAMLRTCSSLPPLPWNAAASSHGQNTDHPLPAVSMCPSPRLAIQYHTHDRGHDLGVDGVVGTQLMP